MKYTINLVISSSWVTASYTMQRLRSWTFFSFLPPPEGGKVLPSPSNGYERIDFYKRKLSLAYWWWTYLHEWRFVYHRWGRGRRFRNVWRWRCGSLDGGDGVQPKVPKDLCQTVENFNLHSQRCHHQVSYLRKTASFSIWIEAVRKTTPY